LLYNEPVNLFVAGFLGSPPMNFVAGTLKHDGDKIRFCEIEGGTIDVAFPATSVRRTRVYRERGDSRDPAGGSEVATFSRKEGKAIGMGFPAVVDNVEPMGAETNLYLQTGAHTLTCRSQGAFDHREAGRRLQLEMNLAKAHLFDPISTNRLR